MRLTFGAKILLSLVGTVVLLLGTSLLAVRHQIESQVEVLVEDTVERATRVLAEVELLRAQELERIGRRFTRSIRFAAAMDDALFYDDPAPLVEAAEYELQLAGYTPALLVFRDLDGGPLVRIRYGDVSLDGLGDAEEVLADDCAFDTPQTGYLSYQGILHTVQHCFLELGRQPLGTLTIGLPLDDAVAAQIGDVVGAELCFQVDGACVAGSMDASRAANGESANGARWSQVSRPLPGGPEGAELLLAIPLDGILGPFDRILQVQRVAGGVALLLALLLGVLLSRGLSGPVRTLVRATERVRKGEYDFRVQVASRDEMGDLANAFNGMLADLALKAKYRGVLDKVVSRDVADEMLKGEIRLGGETRRVTTLFADIRGFTSLTEGLESQEVIGMLNEWCDGAAAAVEREGGVVDKFLGDGLMAIFGAPIPHEDHARRALRAALGIQQETAALNQARTDRGQGPLSVGIGLATGDVAAGNSGAQSRMNYTVLGETVNLAARLCGEAEGGEILASEVTWNESDGALHGEPAEPRTVKGLSYQIRPWRVLGEARTVLAVLAPLLLAGTLLAPAAATAQFWPPDPPTLADLGVEYISPTGAFQLLTSGRLEAELFAPSDEEPWLIAETDPFVAGRLRLFLDAFWGDRIMGTLELRADRGQAPSSGDLQARLQQAFLRVGLDGAGLWHVQVGQFVGPFGNYPSRARTPADPFVRPPLLYDYRTMACAGIAPPNTAAFLTWKDRPDEFRAKGAPIVWDVPYPTGALIIGSMGQFRAQFGVLNSAPSAEPSLWRLDTGRRGNANWVAHLSAQLIPELNVGLSHSRGSWLKPEVEGFDAPSSDSPNWNRGEGAAIEDYDQFLWSAEATWARGRFEARGEVVWDLWEVPNVPYDVQDTSWYLEGRMRTGGGGWVAARYGEIRFNKLPRTGSGEDMSTGAPTVYEPWDYDISRVQLAAGYRLSRSVDVRAEYMLNRIAEGPRSGGDLLSVRLGWSF